jgi:hypothetical protein
LDAYVALKRAEARCHCNNHSRTLCEACIAYDQHEATLRRLFGLEPWEDVVAFDFGSGSTWEVAALNRYKALERDGCGDRQRCGIRQRAGFFGLDRPRPKQMSTGDRTILGRIFKRGNSYLRTLFMQAARVILLRPASWPKHGFGIWLARAAQRLHPNVLAAALANKLARIAWTVLAQERSYEARIMKAAA